MTDEKPAEQTRPAAGESWTPGEMREWIDRQNYAALLCWWRFAPAGDQFFQGETGDHYRSAMAERRAQESDGGVGASKRVGWDAEQGKQGRPVRPGPAGRSET